MYRLFFALFIMSLGILSVFGMDDETYRPSSLKAQEGKTVYIPIPSAVTFTDESKIQQEDQNSTGHGKAK